MIQPLILTIDLSSQTFKIEEIHQEVIKKYIGGRGLGAYLLYHSVPAKADPLGAENHIIFTAGPASNTNLLYSSKVNVNTKSPLTDIYLYSISSGILAQQMKMAGYWAIDITGAAESPTFLSITKDTVEFKNAAELWGLEPAEAQRRMLAGRPATKSATVAIGPAGEKLVNHASIFTDGQLYRCFGRGGAGAVMGSKKLKGFQVKGDDGIGLHDRIKTEPLNKKTALRLKTDLKGWADLWRRYETAADLATMNKMGALPTRNWQAGTFEGWPGIDKSTTPLGWPEKGRSCGPFCPTPGCRDILVKDGPYLGACSDVEWETVYAFGSNCGIDKMDAIIAASQICDEFGIDTMTAGLTISFAMECFEKGLIDTRDTDGIELRFGDDAAMIAVLHKIAGQEGFGKRLAMGVMRLSKEIKGSEAFAMHSKGMEFGGYECRGLNGQALQFAIDNRGGCHHGYGLPAREELFDNTRLNVTGKGEQVKQSAISRIVRDSLIVCTFTPIYSTEMVTEVLSALFEENWTPGDIQEVGTRIMCQERLFNMREGITRKDDSLPDRLLNEPKPDGPTKGAVVPLEALKDEYYKAMEYDPQNGNPTDALLTRLGIEK